MKKNDEDHSKEVDQKLKDDRKLKAVLGAGMVCSAMKHAQKKKEN